jgi:DNA-binding response OmpR family regulator
MAHSPRILVVAPNDDERGAISKALARDFEIVGAADFTRADALLTKSHFGVIVIKGAGSPDEGIDFIKRVRADERLAGILILVLAEWGTGFPTLALSAGADAFEPDGPGPIGVDRLHTSIERLLGRQAAAAN